MSKRRYSPMNHIWSERYTKGINRGLEAIREYSKVVSYFVDKKVQEENE